MGERDYCYKPVTIIINYLTYYLIFYYNLLPDTVYLYYLKYTT